jgi:hypothetical protein
MAYLAQGQRPDWCRLCEPDIFVYPLPPLLSAGKRADSARKSDVGAKSSFYKRKSEA